MKASDQALFIQKLTDLIAKINLFTAQELQVFIENNKVYQSTAISKESYEIINKINRKLKHLVLNAENLEKIIKENAELPNEENFPYQIRQKIKVMEADAYSCIKEARSIMKPIAGFTVAETELLDLQSQYNKFLEHKTYTWTVSSKFLQEDDFKKMNTKFRSYQSLYQHITETNNQKIKKISAENTSENVKIGKKKQVYKEAIKELESFDQIYKQATSELNEKMDAKDLLQRQKGLYSKALLEKLEKFITRFNHDTKEEVKKHVEKRIQDFLKEIKPRLEVLKKEISLSALPEEDKNNLSKQLDTIVPTKGQGLEIQNLLNTELTNLERVVKATKNPGKHFFTVFKSIETPEDKVKFLNSISQLNFNLNIHICENIESQLAEFTKTEIPILAKYIRNGNYQPSSLTSRLQFVEFSVSKDLDYQGLLNSAHASAAIKTVIILINSKLDNSISEALIQNSDFCKAVIELHERGMLDKNTLAPLQENPNRGSLINFYLHDLKHPNIAQAEERKFQTQSINHFLTLDSKTIDVLKQLSQTLKEPVASQLLQPWFLIFANTSPTLLNILNSQFEDKLSANAEFLRDLLDNGPLLNMYADKYLTNDDNEWEKNRIIDYFNEKEAGFADLLTLNKIPDKFNQIFKIRNQINEALERLEAQYENQPEASASFANFERKMVPILLSSGKNEDKKGQLLKLAHKEFKHRHAVSRILDGIIHILNHIFSPLTGNEKNKFFSPKKTKRESEIGKTISESFKKKPASGA